MHVAPSLLSADHAETPRTGYAPGVEHVLFRVEHVPLDRSIADIAIDAGDRATTTSMFDSERRKLDRRAKRGCTPPCAFGAAALRIAACSPRQIIRMPIGRRRTIEIHCSAFRFIAPSDGGSSLGPATGIFESPHPESPTRRRGARREVARRASWDGVFACLLVPLPEIHTLHEKPYAKRRFSDECRNQNGGEQHAGEGGCKE